MADTPRAEPQRAAVVGGGLMGHGIAQVLAAHGIDVVVTDPVPDALAAVPDRIAANLASLGGTDPEPVLARITLEPDLETAVANAEIVFEAAPENLELKQSIFAQLDSAAPADAILATNSSVMRVRDIGAHAQRRHRIVGTHWWNPPFLVPLVEVVEGPDTSAETVDRTIALLRDTLGKTPVHVKRDVAGFVGNRLQHALWREAFNLIDEGVCDPQTVDVVIKESFGRRLAVLGPVENADLIGLDLTLAIHDYVLPTLDPPSQPSRGLRDRVDRGELGMKTGTGFCSWEREDAEAVRQRVLAHFAAASRNDQEERT